MKPTITIKLIVLISVWFTFYIVTGSTHYNSHKSHHHQEIHPTNISTKELRKVSEEIFNKFSNNYYRYANINIQSKRDAPDAKDEAPEPLFNAPKDLFKMSLTIDLLCKLYDNYEIDSLKAEDITSSETAEEDQFIDALLETDLMMHTMDFLAKKEYFSKNHEVYRNVLKKIWFHPYARSNVTRAVGSSGFEHVFVVEKNRHHITGLHNWIFFASREYDNKANYLGFIKIKRLADKAAVMKFYLSYMNKIKLSSMFVGTPPEFDFALYTLCFYARPSKPCDVLLGGEKIRIQSYVQHANDDKLVSSAYPRI
ncbi:poly(U)-specific endoribonuclease homolog [Copidosoma floridanum]|uniref:poly(U)-specific endoribonuclease homolog n=1 Tax=Copidosoma floridanum TaxID=29053 RepID=UPI0006C982C9|nr:poly(U)-specific endoribonuclease homolog [Copidosoma floridanum]